MYVPSTGHPALGLSKRFYAATNFCVVLSSHDGDAKYEGVACHPIVLWWHSVALQHCIYRQESNWFSRYSPFWQGKVQ